ncbi:fibronectin/fibrinogen-binding protein [Vagococcus coleopterorum]|uniref:Rqc2 homolog RqcH n=1 Tax=Vagococcus coleopterorum TaxID=2714946 RepID=A0A6G8ANN4_9ENTE|nr:NFACT RNA binding domain-containing protein [Vagococcus coleopterorum]QIL46552.1 fibronectin/fibrinogen-binding protein [Vagococcus coleopterorum]
MSFDGVFTHSIIHELKAKIQNGRLSKVHQPYDNELVLIIRQQGQNHKLLLSAHSQYARIQLTSMEYHNPTTPPNFCLMLRKHLEGAIIQDIKQIENDRIVEIHFSKRNDLGDLEDIALVVELMGRHSNIVLVNQENNKILDCIKHVGPSQNTFRILLPGADYVQPPINTKQENPYTIDQTKLFELLSTADELSATFFQENFQGLGKDTANELAHRMLETPTEPLGVWKQFWHELESEITPTLSIYENKEYFTPISFDSLGPERYTFPTLHDLLDQFYDGKAEKERVKQQAGELIRKIENERKKMVTKKEKLTKDLAQTTNAELVRQKGELLTTYLHEVPRGANKITLENYYEDNQPIEIQLREDLSPSQNAQKYFHKYGKLKNSVKIIGEQLELVEKEAAYLDSVLSQLDLATPKEIEYIREELISERYIRAKKIPGKRNSQAKSKPETYLSSDGVTILVGKNNIQNDQLTMKTADKNHIWLHAKDIPGSHVIIQDSTPSYETIEEAAILAAYYSKYRLSASVPVDYVKVKHVKKPNGSKPGYVIYENQKTVFVTPNKLVVDSLRK